MVVNINPVEVVVVLEVVVHQTELKHLDQEVLELNQLNQEIQAHTDLEIQVVNLLFMALQMVNLDLEVAVEAALVAQVELEVVH